MEHISTSPNFVHYFRQKCILWAPKNAAVPNIENIILKLKEMTRRVQQSKKIEELRPTQIKCNFERILYH